MKAKVSDLWWDLFLSTLKYLDEKERNLLVEHVEKGIEFLPRHGCCWPQEVKEPRVTGYISQVGLDQLMAGNKAIVKSRRDDLNNVPLYAGSTK